jgi:hypothetical protein
MFSSLDLKLNKSVEDTRVNLEIRNPYEVALLQAITEWLYMGGQQQVL